MTSPPKHPEFKVPGFQSAVAKAVAAFNASAPEPLLTAHQKAGAVPGVYAIYYRGICDYPEYRQDADLNRIYWQQPIYVGRAQELSARLKQHWESIGAVEDKRGNLKVSQFACRFLAFEQGAVEDLIYPTEQALIRDFHPIWNKYVTGFGSKVVGKERETQKMSAWEVLHPGRLGRATGGDPTARKADLLEKMKSRQMPPATSASRTPP